ncbi:MAG: helix-hairpin-helix domain-containing protein [Clostridiales bacterium]|nr:helix-hairpin-helix domain-containing protein [Clostridiales bacterium]
MKTKTRNVVYVAAFVITLVISLVYKLFLNGRFDALIDKPSDQTDIYSSESIIYEEPSEISVYICGHVNDPGVYKTQKGSILNDVVELAGGLSEDAAWESIDLVYVLTDNISIYIPSEEEALPGEFSVQIIGDPEEEGKVNINTADKEELMSLPGIGEATASAIINYREDNTFGSVEDIMNVSGIGESKFNNIKDLICV